MVRRLVFSAILILFATFVGGVLLYGAEAYLAWEEYDIELGTSERIRQAAEKAGAKWDSRSQAEVVRDLRAAGKDAHPSMAPSVFVDTDGIEVDGEKLFPFGGLSHTTNVFCNEMGDWSVYESDEHGFNNPAGAWRPGDVDVAIIGDSFVHGACLKPGDDIASQLRRNGLKSLNIGMGGTGPIIYSAVLKEYAEPMRPKVVVWSYYAVDIRDPISEKNSPTLMRYLEDPGFSQHLFDNQPKVDRILRKYFDVAYQKRLDELATLRQNRREIITDRLISQGLRLHKLRERASRFGKRPVVEEGREEEKLALFERTLLHAKRETESWGGKFVFMYLPDWYSYAAEYDTYGIKIDKNFLLRQDVLSIVRKHNIPLLDMQSEVFDKQRDPVSLYNWRMYGHYSLEGYTLVSNRLAQFLLEYIPKPKG
jgi:hypothetical protein